MPKKNVFLLLTLVLILALTACTNKEALNFKKNYEDLNGTVNKNGKEHRAVNIASNNPFIKSSAKEVIEKIEAGDNLYIYFGSSLCPWCRSVIEKATEVANNNGIDKIYYVDIWSETGEEILRDKYTLDDNGNAIKIIDGTQEYFKLLTYLDDVLPDYKYAANKNGGEELNVDEKRIYIPLFVYIAKGKVIRSTSGISELQAKSRDELTTEILNDEEKMFDDFFINVCDESC